MSDPSDQGEPTMEEILASIRKIISEDDPEAAPEEASAAKDASTEAEAAPDDVLELTERVEDEAERSQEEEIEAILASVTGGDDSEGKGTGDSKAGGIVSPHTDAAVTNALSDFAGALIEQNRGQGGPVGDNQALDSLVRSALEPHLKSWLDEHLETLVERVLREEIKRMARRAEDI